MLLSELASGGPLFFNLVPLVVLIPVIGLLTNMIIGDRLYVWLGDRNAERAIGIIASTAAGLAFVIALLLGVSLLSHPEGVVVPFLDWIHVGDLEIDWAFQVDTLAVTMMLVVSGVGTLIHVYSIGYMHEDVKHNGDLKRYKRFFVFMNLFIASMMLLVSASNYLMLFVGWEGVGLCSYLLIGFWYDKGEDGIGNALAGKKAFITNRIGDFGMLIAIFILFWAFGSLNFEVINEKAPAVAGAAPGIILAITIFMLVGVTGKSAQIPLFVWLPDAMAGPTPVSALIHAATMVTAGVYLITRSNVLYSLVPEAQMVVALVGATTALFSATIATAQFDIKKVLAYSTISQLGFMVAAVGMGAYVAGMFHLVTHAFFKALLFLGAGSVIQGVEYGHHYAEHDENLRAELHERGEEHDFDPQDIRNMGGIRKQMKVTFWTYIIGALALAGVVPLAGFWSKDEILAEATDLNKIVYYMLVIAALFTAFYIGRQVFYVFFGNARTLAAKYAKENPLFMTIPLIILAFLAVWGGGLNIPRVHTFTIWMEETIENVHVGEFNMQVAILSTLFALGSIFIAWLIYYKIYRSQRSSGKENVPDDPLRPVLGPVFTLFEHKYWIDELYWTLFVNPYVAFAKFLADVVDWRFLHDWLNEFVIAGGYKHFSKWLATAFDLKVIDAFANWLAKIVEVFAAWLRRSETGYVRNYALSVFLGLVLIIGYLILR
jgi:NADH-quinone oxidoreductase subunit L